MNNEEYLNYRNANRRKTYRKRAGRKRLPVFLLLLMIAVIIGGACFALAKENNPGTEEVTPLPSPTATVTPTPVTGPTPEGESQKEEIKVAEGPFGLWDPTSTPSPTINIPEGEEIWMADFVDNREVVEAKGIYVSADIAKVPSKLESLIDLLDTTELNALVIDVKADSGAIVYSMDNETAKEIGATRNIITDMKGMLKTLHEHGIYVIARVVAFKDPILAAARPDLCFYNNDGSKFYDSSNCAWVSPYKQEVWDYLVSVGVSCAEVGFDEINFDYIRFPTDGVANINWGKEAETTTKIEAITAGIKYTCEELRMHDIFISADVYGIVISSAVDAAAVGQDYQQMSRYLDYICPMIYPSHYGFGYAGISYPDTEPNKIIRMALASSNKKIAEIPDYQHKAICRPWLQDFTASYLGTKNGVQRYLTYDAEVVRIEIDSVYQCELGQWLLWNAGGVYTEGALLPEE